MDNEVWLKTYKPIAVAYAKQFAGMYTEYELEDLVSVATLAIFESLPKYKGKNDAIERTFLVRCVINALIDHVRSEKKHKDQRSDIDVDEIFDQHQPSALETMMLDETINELAEDEIDKIIIAERMRCIEVTQEAIAEESRNQGFEVDRSTISRRIKKLKKRGFKMREEKKL